MKLGENQELLVRGPSVMVGYWNRPEDTARVKAPDGWLHTGDQARIDNGRIYIIGRIKEIIVTSTGEKVSPGDLETAILADTLFANAMVLGENRPYLAVVAALDPEIWAREKKALADEAEPGALKAQADFLLARIRAAVKSYPAYATPRAVCVDDRALDGRIDARDPDPEEQAPQHRSPLRPGDRRALCAKAGGVGGNL